MVIGAERWEIDLAVAIALVRHHEDSTPVATDLVCEMQGIDDAGDRQLVRERVALQIGLEATGVAA